MEFNNDDQKQTTKALTEELSTLGSFASSLNTIAKSSVLSDTESSKNISTTNIRIHELPHGAPSLAFETKDSSDDSTVLESTIEPINDVRPLIPMKKLANINRILNISKLNESKLVIKL